MNLRRSRLWAILLTCSGLTGCASFWDDVTSRDFSLSTYFNPPDPITVLQTSTDGDARARAYARLGEPRQNGGGQVAQEEVVQLLTKAAMSEPQPLCRMAAIRALGKFQDPRAVPALIGAFDAADGLTPELAFMVRSQALTALGETKQPEAAKFVVEVARRPIRSDLSERERYQARDVRLSAVRALKNFPDSQPATAAVEALAADEKDVAVRDRAKETFVSLTGREPSALTNTTPKSADNSIVTVGHQQPVR